MTSKLHTRVRRSLLAGVQMFRRYGVTLDPTDHAGSILVAVSPADAVFSPGSAARWKTWSLASARAAYERGSVRVGVRLNAQTRCPYFEPGIENRRRSPAPPRGDAVTAPRYPSHCDAVLLVRHSGTPRRSLRALRPHALNCRDDDEAVARVSCHSLSMLFTQARSWPEAAPRVP